MHFSSKCSKLEGILIKSVIDGLLETCNLSIRHKMNLTFLICKRRTFTDGFPTWICVTIQFPIKTASSPDMFSCICLIVKTSEFLRENTKFKWSWTHACVSGSVFALFKCCLNTLIHWSYEKVYMTDGPKYEVTLAANRH